MSFSDKWFGVNKPVGAGAKGHGYITIENGLMTCSQCGRLPGHGHGSQEAMRHAGTHNTMDTPIDIFKDGELYDTMG